MAPMDAIQAGFSEDVAITYHFVVTRPPPPSHPIGVLLVLAMSVKNYLKWWEIQLAIYPIVGGQIDYKLLQNRGKISCKNLFPFPSYNTSNN